MMMSASGQRVRANWRVAPWLKEEGDMIWNRAPISFNRSAIPSVELESMISISVENSCCCNPCVRKLKPVPILRVGMQMTVFTRQAQSIIDQTF